MTAIRSKRSGASRDFGAPVLAAWMFLGCCAAVLLGREALASLWEWLSALLQYASLWLAYVLVDDRLSDRRYRFALAAAAALFTALALLDGLLMRITSLPLHEILPMLLASEHIVEGLREIGLTPARLSLLLAALSLSALAGGIGRMLLSKLAARRERAQSAGPALAVLVAMLSVYGAEQAWARDHQTDYLFRSMRIPLYAALFTTSTRSIELSVPSPVSHQRRADWLAHVEHAKKPLHVLYVLLESFRADAIDPTVSPQLWQLAQEGTWYTQALAEATYTPLSWSVLLFDEAASDNLFGRHPGRPKPAGGYLFALLERAGLSPHAFVSTNLTYGKTRERLLGEHSRLDLFQAAADKGDDPADKNRNDRVAVDHAVEFVQRHNWSVNEPQLLLLQLDSTHYTYPFPESDALFRPYSESLILPRPIETQTEAELLHNRYRNAAHYVDAQLARLIAALKARGVYDDTLIVVTSDHGEGLAPGLQGHGPVTDTTRRVPLIVRVPGQVPQRSAALVSHRDILPTLAKTLDIRWPQRSLRGRGLDRADAHAVLTIAPSGRFGQLSMPDRVVDLSLVWKPNALIVTPVRTTQHADAAASDDDALWLPALQQFLQCQDPRPETAPTLSSGI